MPRVKVSSDTKKKNKLLDRRNIDTNGNIHSGMVRDSIFQWENGLISEKRPINKERFYQTMKRPRKTSPSQSYASYRAFLNGSLNSSTENCSSLSLPNKVFEEQDSKTSIETFNEYSFDSTMEYESTEVEEQLVEPKVALITASLSDIRTLSLESLKSENQEFLEAPKKRKKSKLKSELWTKKVDTPTVVLRSKQKENLKSKPKKRTTSETEAVTLRKKPHSKAFPADEEVYKQKRLSLQEPKSARSKKVYRSTTLYWENHPAESDDLENLVFNVSKEARIQSRFNDTILHSAATNGQLDIVRFYVDKNRYLNEQNGHLNTALHCATFYKHFDIIKTLLDYDADLNLQNVDGDTALHLACDKELTDVVDLFVSKGCKLNIQNENGETALHVAVHRQKLEITQMLIENGADITLRNKHGNTPLHSAIHYFATRETISFLMETMEKLKRNNNRNHSVEETTGDESYDDFMVVEKTDDLVDSGTETDNEGQNSGEFDDYCVVEFDSTTKKIIHDVTDGKTMSCNVTHGSTKNEILSATVNTPNDYAEFSADVCSSSEETKTDTDLPDQGNNAIFDKKIGNWQDLSDTETKQDLFNLLNEGGDTLLHRAIKYCSKDIVHMILRYPNVRVDILNKKGNSVLHCAAILPDEQTAKLIIARERSLIDLKNGLGNTPLHCATKRGLVKIVATLIKEGANVNLQNNDGETPYFYAVKYGQLDCLKMLLEAHADGKIPDGDGKLPINYAIENCNVPILELICQYSCQHNDKVLLVNLKNHHGDAPIHNVLKNHTNVASLQLIKVLADNFADLNAVDNHGNTALHLALESNNKELIDVLLEETNFGLQNNDGDTVLHLIAQNNYIDLMSKIKPTAAELGVKNKKELTPLNIALQCCYGDMSLTLLNMTWNLEISL